jgi:serine/threonine protein kinase
MSNVSRSEASVNPFTKEMREGRDIPGFIATWRYKPIRIIGKGQWGTVFEAEDLLAESMTGEDHVITSVAIKVPSLTNLAEEQMAQRNKDILGSFLGEARFKTTPHVLPATVDVDAQGTPYVIMPLCKRSLEAELAQGQHVFNRRDVPGIGYICDNVDETEAIDRYMRDIAAGINEWHNEHHKVHGDLKLDNFLVDEKGRVFLSDGGNATMASMPAWSESPRDNMGCLHTRAPELFQKGSHPTTQSDVYAAGAMFYRLVHGSYPLEDQFKTQAEAEAFFAQHTAKEIESIMKKKVAQVPRKYRKLIKEALAFRPEARPHDGSSLETRTKEALHTHTVGEQVISALKRSALLIGLPIAVAVGGYWLGANHYERDAQIENKDAFFGTMYFPDSPKEVNYCFDFEKYPARFLPSIKRGLLIDSSDIDVYAQRGAKVEGVNKTAAYLTAQFQRAHLDSGFTKNQILTDYQMMNWVRNSSVARVATGMGGLGARELFHHKVAFNIANALAYQRKTATDVRETIDFEDTLVIARHGLHTLDRLRKASGSMNFVTYLNAKDKSGKFILEESEQQLMKTWIAYATHFGR